MFRIFVVNENLPFRTYVARTLTDARRVAKDESKYYPTERVKIIDLRISHPYRDEFWQNGKKEVQ